MNFLLTKTFYKFISFTIENIFFNINKNFIDMIILETQILQT